MQTKRLETPARVVGITDQAAFCDAVRDYLRTYALRHSRSQSTQHCGIPCHTLWCCPERKHPGHSLLGAVVKAIGDAPDTVVAAAWAMTASRQSR